MTQEASNPQHDKIYGILRDLINKAITLEDAVAKLKGLQDGSELKVDSFKPEDNVQPNTSKPEDEEEMKTVSGGRFQPVIENDEKPFVPDVDHTIESNGNSAEPIDSKGKVSQVEPEQPKVATESEANGDEDDEVAPKRPINRKKVKKENDES